MQGKTIVVTGAFGILGRAAAAAAATAGAKVAMLDIAVPATNPVSGAIAMKADLTDPESAAAAMRKVRDDTGRIDALLNIAGGFAWQTVADGDAKTWDRMFTLNLKTALNATKAALPFLIEAKGAIVNIGANAALNASAGMGAYAASKSGVHKLTESLAQEQKGRVRVNAVLPSILDTPQNRADMPKADPSTWVKPEDLAKVLLFLVSDQARDITGALIPVTGRV
ncbi:MAG: SDR family NAD(P)-dependent oxidoreductase [Alphaproteobacteria bacterium]|nr:SDR family NAD(P)-dependent oxidoreductase [Alphaproteobacteria bacterium]